MKHLQHGTLLAATLSTGLMAGLFAAFAYSVMPGLARSSDHTFVDAMQRINEAILNPVFMLPFMGSIPLLGLAIVLAWRTPGRPAVAWLIAALACYLIAFMVTSGVNVPLNDQLAKAGDPDHVRRLATVRSDFEHQWVASNIVRAVLHTASFACMAWALLVYGAHALPAGRSTESPAQRHTGSPGALHDPAAADSPAVAARTSAAGRPR
ncbi:anthrone oxygenase family protein [Nocardioides sp. YIM 152315]|uniref:anthrone oxygenase family protein n=1 Tax=Nocardioides sp. YIM 152315 TaxID=3031760 RepID=UPI0023DA99C9|nr:anthrone oxygenase family protein [Nocardioides sp. YIM 152315]MDF1604528.1 DUF1772 domain-containing protein [Nocardioides sp. YIM 152315]